MSDDAPGTPRVSRRSVLALGGTAALAGLAGCTGLTDLNPLGEEEPPKIDGSALEQALSGETPAVPDPLPVDVEAAYVDRRVADARESLSSVPAPFDAEEVPNGMIREELAGLYDRATAALDDVADASSAAARLGSLRRARRSVREVEAAWAAIEGDLTYDDVRGSVPEIRADLDAFRERWRYVGDDPIRAVLTHARIEELVASAGRRVLGESPRTRSPRESALGVGELAGDLEAARAALDDADYLFGRFVDSLDEPRSVAAGLEAAGESLSATLAERRVDLPSVDSELPSYVDGNVERKPIAYALSDLRRGAEYADGIADERATGRRAMVVLSALETLVRLRAFELLRRRVENGEYVTVGNAADVRAIRESAVSALEDALGSGEYPRLDRRMLRWADDVFEYVPERIGEYEDDEEVSVEWLARDLGEYVIVEATALATPETAAEGGDAIRSNL